MDFVQGHLCNEEKHMNQIQVNTPRVMFAAMRSGSGKTTVTCGVLAALKKQNIKVQAYKCGPDYIDPMFHRTVLGIDTGNLDTFFAGADAIGRILARDTKDAEMCVMEGVMGYYDGVGGTTTMASSYELSKVTKTPVVLIVDAKGASVTLAATIRGIMEYKKDSRIAGVILNRVSPMFYSRLKQVIETECGIPVLGYLLEDASFAVPSRHLGLMQPDEMQKQRDWVETVAEAVMKTIDINGILEIAAQAETLQIQAHVDMRQNFEDMQQEADDVRQESVNILHEPADARQEIVDMQDESANTSCGHAEESENCKFPSGYRIGVARDAAFSFYYRENLRMLEDMGAKLVYFSPLEDAHVPKVDALIFGGGYPELYAKQLYDNRSMRASVRQALEAGMPCHAECGGFLYLGKSLADAEGNVYEMVGFLDGAGFQTERLQRFGYVELAPQDAGVFAVNTVLRGHEFHYWDSTDCGDACLAWKPLSKQKTYPCMVKKKGTFAGFPHLYYAGAEAFFYHLFSGSNQ